ncbi:hypothetical protein [Tahibacter amnicola]|uniref:Uncharacterized protein n=1 Tax=Tahibacter amnicola TaxID=2976241 RepID=A0ABY6BGP5_9GAMM|nr:hypothetical protein [Tahibacter amnicola]UXI68934.1 hypothetical protein N4264_04565 [Tahibacter amnicola]
MTAAQTTKDAGASTPSRWFVAAPVIGFVVSVAHLAWEASHGGIKSHHLLNDANLPAISNSWGLLALPLLGAVASYVLRRRSSTNPQAPRQALAPFCGALAVGLALSIAFQLDWSEVTSGLFLALLLSGTVLRTYRAEYGFGFVLGMTFVFGSVLPTLVAGVAGGLSAVAHFAVYPGVAAAYRRLRAVSA